MEARAKAKAFEALTQRIIEQRDYSCGDWGRRYLYIFVYMRVMEREVRERKC